MCLCRYDIILMKHTPSPTATCPHSCRGITCIHYAALTTHHKPPTIHHLQCLEAFGLVLPSDPELKERVITMYDPNRCGRYTFREVCAIFEMVTIAPLEARLDLAFQVRQSSVVNRQSLQP